MNRRHAARFPENTELTARIANFETAARMQTAVPEALDLSGESEATKKLYGLDKPETEEYGRRCLLARPDRMLRLSPRQERTCRLWRCKAPRPRMC